MTVLRLLLRLLLPHVLVVLHFLLPFPSQSPGRLPLPLPTSFVNCFLGFPFPPLPPSSVSSDKERTGDRIEMCCLRYLACELAQLGLIEYTEASGLSSDYSICLLVALLRFASSSFTRGVGGGKTNAENDAKPIDFLALIRINFLAFSLRSHMPGIPLRMP